MSRLLGMFWISAFPAVYLLIVIDRQLRLAGYEVPIPLRWSLPGVLAAYVIFGFLLTRWMIKRRDANDEKVTPG